MFGLIVISHSKLIAEGCVNLMASKVAEGKFKFLATGGTEQGTLGITQREIRKALMSCKDLKGCLIFTDLGSSILATDMTLENMAEEGYAVSQMQIVNAPLVEGLMTAGEWIEDYDNILALKHDLEVHYRKEYHMD